MSKVSTQSTQGVVIFGDGGCRPTNPGPGGYGVHGYLYNTDIPKKGAGNSDHLLTAMGYVTKVKAEKSPVVEITPVHYIDGFGAIPNATNNVAELAAAINGLMYVADYDITEVQFFTDSKYVCNGLESWVAGWKANGWLKRDMTPPANVEYWKQLVEAKDKLVNRGVTVKMNWVKGHSDEIAGMEDILGNIIADKLATIGTLAAGRNVVINDIQTTTANGYWKQTVDKHPMLAHRRMYFNTMPEYIKAGEYYLGDHGKDDDLLGKRISDGAYAVVILEQPDPILELVRKHQSDLAKGSDSIIMARLDQIYRPGTYQELDKYGTLAIEQTNAYRLDLACLDREPLTRELRPPKLAMRAVESISELAEILIKYREKDQSLVVTDITSILYEITETGKKASKVLGNVSSTLSTSMKLKPEYNVGYAALKVDVKYKSTNDIVAAPVTLTLGLDLLDRNALKRLEDMNPKVTVITWLEATGIFKYATVIEAGNDIGIWAGVYSNTYIVPK